MVAVGVAVELARDIGVEGRVERFTKKFGVQTSEQRKTAAKAVKATKAAATAATKKKTTKSAKASSASA